MRVLLGIAIICSIIGWQKQKGCADASLTERRLIAKLLEGYTNLERPVFREADVLHVRMGLDFQQIIDVDEKNQMITTSLWIKLYWTDHNLIWNPVEYDNITDVRIYSETLWRPDVLLYNSADSEFSKYFKTNVVVSHDGSCTFMPPGIFKSTCPIRIEHFPFDEQQCKLKFGSWTYSALKLNLTVAAEYNEQPERSSYVQNGEWDLMGIPAKTNVFSYECCPEPYVDVTFTIHLRRRCLFYILNLVVPCALISSMTLLGFTLPPDSGEKLTLAVTILLSLTVFLLVIADSMPATSDAVPLIGIYFSMIMLMTSLSVVLTVIVLNFHYRTPDTHKIPFWVRKVLLEWLPFFLCMQRQDVSTQNQKKTKYCCAVSQLNSIPPSTTDGTLSDEERSTISPTVGDDGAFYHVAPHQTATSPLIEAYKIQQQQQHHDILLDSGNHNVGHAHEWSTATNTNRHSCARHMAQYRALLLQSQQYSAKAISSDNKKTEAAKEELCSILRELQFITNRMQKEDDYDTVCNEWKFAAMVLDRLFLWIMVIFTVASTVGVMSSAPDFRLR